MSVQLDLSGKTTLVTGSTSGIGLGIARAYAKSGSNVILNGIEASEDVQPIVDELSAFGSKVVYSPANMMKPEAIKDLFDMANDSFDGIDILVNNAGIQHVAPIDEFPDGKWDAIIAINMSSNFHTMKHAIPSMKKKGWGRIINIASAHALVASANKSAYVAAKHGVLGMTKTVALEVAQHGITANAICPGYVATPLVEKQLPDQAKTRGISVKEAKDALLSVHATREFVAVEELADLCLFLTSDSGKSITGTAYSVDGGWTAY